MATGPVRLCALSLVLVPLAGCGPGTLVAPAPCTDSAQCGSGACLSFDAVPTCTDRCSDAADCGPQLTCRLARDIADAAVTVCLPPRPNGAATGAVCTAGADCANGVCYGSFCSAICTVCTGGYSCNDVVVTDAGEEIALAVCEWGIDWRATTLGPVVTPSGGSAPIELDVADDTASFTIALVDDDGLRVAVASLVAPDGTVLIDAADGVADLNPGFDYPGAAATAVPSTDDPAARVQPGTYQLVVGTYDPTDWTALTPVAGDIERVLVIPEVAGEEGGLLDLNLHLAPGIGIAIADAPSDPFVGDMVAEAERVLSRAADVSLAEVSFGGTSADHDIIEDGDEIRALMTSDTSGGPRGAAVNVFVVTDITFAGGYAAGRPGPPGVYNTPGSGLVIAALGNDTDTGVLLAHELGHFLGLYHTTELAGGGRDPISDTPECNSGTAITDCPDYDNLMFPMFPLDRPLSLSAGQRRVFRGSPTLYEVSRPGACPGQRVIDTTAYGFASGNTRDLTDDASGSCGGAGAPERLQLYLVPAGASRIDVRVTGRDFAPAVYARVGSCAAAAVEAACASDDAGIEVLLQIQSPPPGPLFFFVDGRDGTGGSFVLHVDVAMN